MNDMSFEYFKKLYLQLKDNIKSNSDNSSGKKHMDAFLEKIGYS